MFYLLIIYWIAIIKNIVMGVAYVCIYNIRTYILFYIHVRFIKIFSNIFQ